MPASSAAPAAPSDRNHGVAAPFPSLAFPVEPTDYHRHADSSERTPEQRNAWRALVASSYVVIRVGGHDVPLQKRQPTATLPDGRTILIEWTADRAQLVTWRFAEAAQTHITPALDEVLRMAAQVLGFREAFCVNASLERIAAEVRKLSSTGAAWLSMYEGRSP